MKILYRLFILAAFVVLSSMTAFAVESAEPESAPAGVDGTGMPIEISEDAISEEDLFGDLYAEEAAVGEDAAETKEVVPAAKKV